MDQLTPEQLAALAKDDKGPLTKSIIFAFTILAAVAVGLRIFTRMRYVRMQLGWEDYAIILALAFSITTGAFQVLQTDAGNGKHAVLISVPALQQILTYLFWSIICYNVSLTLTKISILLQYRRIFTVAKMRIPLHITMAVCVVWGVTVIIFSIFACVPSPVANESPVNSTKKCLDYKTIWYVTAAMNISTDLVVAFLPVRVIWKLQIARRPKIALIAILSIGWFVCVVSFLRLHVLTVVAAHEEDSTYYSAGAAYWSNIEMNLGILCASLPALKPLVVKIIPGFSSRGGSNGTYALGTDVHSKTATTRHGIRSTARRVDTDIELDTSPTPISPQKSGEDILSKNIYVSTHFEQHYDDSRVSDSESQKDLVERH